MAQTISSLPVGAKVKDPNSKYNGQVVPWKIAGHDCDGTGTATLVSERIVAIHAFDAKEPSNTDSNRKNYGNNQYQYSNLLQWLNSAAGAGAWYAAQHSADQSPSSSTYVSYNPYASEAGFLNGFSANFRNALLSKGHITAKNTVTDGGGSEVVTSKIFLLSRTEVNLGNENNIAEGSVYPLFLTADERKACPTPQAVANSDYKTSSLAATSTWYYLLRTPCTGYSYGVRSVYTGGSLSNSGAYGGGYGVRPACVLAGTQLVSDNPDTDGCYVLLYNDPPVIETDPSLGDKNSPFDITFTVTDAEDDACTATAMLGTGEDAVTLMAETSVTLDEPCTVNISQAQFSVLTVGQSCTVRITAADAAGNTAVQDVTFTRTECPILFSGADGDLGKRWQPFSPSYSVTDTAESTSLSVTEAIDDTELCTFMPEPGAVNTVDLEDVWDLLGSEQQHTITVTATNSEGASAVREWTFTKLGGRLRFMTNPIPTDIAARTVLIALRTEATGDQTIMVEATNNAAAAEPVWEDCTEAALSGRTYGFRSRPADGYGVAVRVTQTKGENTERAYCNALGIAFR